MANINLDELIKKIENGEIDKEEKDGLIKYFTRVIREINAAAKETLLED